MSDKKGANKKLKKLWNLESLKSTSLGVMLNPVRIEIRGNREAVVEGCKSILHYDENIVKVNMNKMIVSFFGRNMEIKCLTSDSLVIRGFITSIEYLT